ncbi:MAG: hypothetical protein ABJC87_09795, partial [Roseobacter sp.]
MYGQVRSDTAAPIVKRQQRIKRQLRDRLCVFTAVNVIVAPLALRDRPLPSPPISNNLQNTYYSVQAMYISRVVVHSHATQY